MRKKATKRQSDKATEQPSSKAAKSQGGAPKLLNNKVSVKAKSPQTMAELLAKAPVFKGFKVGDLIEGIVTKRLLGRFILILAAKPKA